MFAGPRGSRSRTAAILPACSSVGYSFVPPDGQPRWHHHSILRPSAAKRKRQPKTRQVSVCGAKVVPVGPRFAISRGWRSVP
jgi:hypothetical protein